MDEKRHSIICWLKIGVPFLFVEGKVGFMLNKPSFYFLPWSVSGDDGVPDTPPTTHKRGSVGVMSFCFRGRIVNWPKGIVGEPKNSPFFKKTPDSTSVFGKNIGGLYKITSAYFPPALAFCVKAGVSLPSIFKRSRLLEPTEGFVLESEGVF